MQSSIDIPELALSMIQPMGTALVLGWKPIENRKWKPWARVIGKMIAIHASAKWDVDYRNFVYRVMDPGAAEPKKRIDLGKLIDTAPQNAIIGVARVTGFLEHVVDNDPSYGHGGGCNFFRRYDRSDRYTIGKAVQPSEREAAWFTGPYGWTIADVRAIDPIPCKGALALWRVPIAVRDILAERLKELS